MSDEVAAVTKTYQLILWAVPIVNKFPRDHRFTLGDRMVNGLYELLELLIEASYLREKDMTLNAANLKVNKLRYMTRLAKDLRLLTINRYEYSAKNLVEIGQQIGGWRKAKRLARPEGDQR